MVCVSDYGLLLNWSNRQRYRGREAECIETEIPQETLGGNERMKIKITGTPEEIEKLLNAIGDSKEQLRILKRIERNTEPLTGNGEKH